jgi:hypothetical protein
LIFFLLIILVFMFRFLIVNYLSSMGIVF